MIRLALVIALFIGSTASAYDGRQTIAPEHRVSNLQVGIGVCFWSCSEMVGRQQGLTRLYDLRDWVIHDGTGRDEGADIFSRLYWAAKINVNQLTINDEENEKFLFHHIAERPLVVGMHWPAGKTKYGRQLWGRHAIVLTDIFKADDGFWYVTYIDSNDVSEEKWHNWAWFRRYWDGHAVAYLPGRWLEDKPTEVNPIEHHTVEQETK